MPSHSESFKVSMLTVNLPSDNFVLCYTLACSIGKFCEMLSSANNIVCCHWFIYLITVYTFRYVGQQTLHLKY